MRSLRFSSLALLVLAAFSVQGCSMGQRASGGGSGNVSAGSARLDVVNNSSQAVYSLNASSCSSSSWGPDRLGTQVVAAGREMSFDLTPGCWDFRADFDTDHTSGNELTQRNIQIGSGSSWTWTISG